MIAFKITLKNVSPERLFMGSVLLVNGGNYLYNLVLGRLLGPEVFAEAALLVTLLLVLSFLGMTFQLATAKFAVLFDETDWKAFEQLMYKYALGFGMLVGTLLFAFSESLKDIFQTESALLFKTFATAVPLYFFMSVNRGKYQGNQDYKKLSISYQTEMWSRLLLTLSLLWFVPFSPSFLVAFGIALSFVFGLIPIEFDLSTRFKKLPLDALKKKQVTRFITLTACYELTQIIINNSDILLVKHYFDAVDAGLYASLALIGRVVYFIAWMFVMLLLPAVVQKQKDGEATAPILFKYLGYVGILSLSIVTVCALCPELIINLMFGEAYLTIAPLLWQYALATSLFALANIFTYYFLSLDEYTPVLVSGFLGVMQILLIVYYHNSLEIILFIQIAAMTTLLLAQLFYFSNKQILAK